MGKVLLALSILILLFIGIGTYKTPNDPMFWLASSSTLYQIVRGILGVFLLAQVLTQPPRKIWFRLLSGIVAVVAGAWTLWATCNFTMPALDTFVFLSATTTLLITAIERRLTPSTLEKLSVSN